MKNIFILLCVFLVLGGCLDERNDIVPDLPENFGTNVNRTLIWYFGDYAGIDFNSTPPTALLNSNMKTNEGCATLCDAQGNLLMYTDGSDIWDSDHQNMPNSNGLGGSFTSTQSGIIVPFPDDENMYYVFSVDAEGQNGGLQYAIVDILASEGKGEVISKNHRLMDKCSEKLTTVLHSNGESLWLIAHEYGNNNFAVFHITAEGVTNTPKVISIGSDHDSNGSGTIGYLKGSPGGSKLVLAEYGSNFVELFDFDNSTGEITNPILFMDPAYHRCYGVEFSSDNSKLYFAGAHNSKAVFQADLSLSSEEEILNSVVQIGETTSNFFGALQNGPDGKIYIAKRDGEYLSVINKPNLAGVDCKFEEDLIYLGGRLSIYGLPNLIPSFFR